VKFFSSQVLGLLLAMRTRLSSYGGQVIISAINPQLHRVFKITNLDQVFRFFPDAESAIDSLKSG
jgi:anti-anti-sigma factor